MSTPGELHLTLVNVAQKILPDIKGIDVRFADQIKLAEQINITIHVDKGNEVSSNVQQKSAIWVAPQSSVSGNAARETLALTPKRDKGGIPTADTDAKVLPVTTGTLIVINNPAFWDLAEPVILNNTHLVPMQFDQPRLVQSFGHGLTPHFEVCVHSDNSVALKLWDEHTFSTRVIRSRPCYLSKRHGQWLVRPLRMTEVLMSGSHLGIGFDPAFVGRVMVLERTGRQQSLERYVLVLRGTSDPRSSQPKRRNAINSTRSRSKRR